MVMPAWMFTQYPAPGGMTGNGGLGYGQLKEQKRSNQEREGFLRDQFAYKQQMDAAAEARRLDQERFQTMLALNQAVLENKTDKANIMAMRAQQLGIDISAGAQPEEGLPQLPGQVAQPPAAQAGAATPGDVDTVSRGADIADKAMDFGEGPTVAELEGMPASKRDYYAEDTADERQVAQARAALSTRAKGAGLTGPMARAVETDDVEAAMAAGDQKALEKQFSKGVVSPEDVTLEEETGPELTEDPETVLAQMKAAEQKGADREKAVAEQKAAYQKEAEALVVKAQKVGDKDPAQAAELLAEANAIMPHPQLALSRGKLLERAGDPSMAQQAYAEAASMDPVEITDRDSQLWNVGIQEAGEKLQGLEVITEPSQIQVPIGKRVMDGFTASWGGQTLRITPDMMSQARHQKFDGMWGPIQQNAPHEVLKQMAGDARRIGHDLINAGMSPAEAFEATNEQYKERSAIWAKLRGQELAAYAQAKKSGDNLVDERWKRKNQYVNQERDNIKAPKFLSELEQLDYLAKLAESPHAKARNTAWMMAVGMANGGRPSDKDYQAVAGAGTLWERIKEMGAQNVTGKPTEEQVAAMRAITKQIAGSIRSYLLNSVKGSMDMWRQDPSNRELYGDNMDADVAWMTRSIIPGVAPEMNPHRGGGAAAPSGGGSTSSMESGTVRQSGPIGGSKPSALDQLKRIRGGE